MTIGDIFENAINHWRDNKGIGTALIPHPVNDKFMALGVLQKIYSRSPTTKSLIIVTTFKERSDIIEFLTNQEDEENNKEFKDLIRCGTICVLTDTYLKSNGIKFDSIDLCILYRPDSIDDIVFKFVLDSKFKLIILNKLIQNGEQMSKLYYSVPLLNDFKQNEILELRLSTPVEEYQVPISIPEQSEDYNTLDKYNKYITTSINIFGSFKLMQEANTGNKELNISSSTICSQIAASNGWNEHLDMTVSFNQNLDELYNPIALKERASNTYEIIRERNKLLSDYEHKLEVIKDIVNSNLNKKILIISKRAEFATKITEYLNNSSEKDICGSYHDKLVPIPATDIEGNPVYYKSGSKKGQRKWFAATSQKNINVQKFNQNDINIISTNNSPDKDLAINVDIVIITSLFCESLSAYLYRLDKINFPPDKIILYSVYCENSAESKILGSRNVPSNYTIKTYSNDENISDFIVED